jgi:hypothetical protein
MKSTKDSTLVSCIVLVYLSFINDTVNSSSLTFEVRLTSKLRIGDRRGKNLPCSNLRRYPGICQAGLRSSTKNFRKNSRSPGTDFSPGTPGYKEEIQIHNTQPLRSVCGGHHILNVSYEVKKVFCYFVH